MKLTEIFILVMVIGIGIILTAFVISDFQTFLGGVFLSLVGIIGAIVSNSIKNKNN